MEKEPDEEISALYRKYLGESIDATKGKSANNPFGGEFDNGESQNDDSEPFDKPGSNETGKTSGGSHEELNREKKRPKSKKALQKEEMERKKAEMKTKSIRSIYISLAKMLHPDSEPDPALKLEKEELMKQVTSAYQKSDMLRLLKLETRWVTSHRKQLEGLDNETLKVYTELLKDQVTSLEGEHFMLLRSRPYQDVFRYAYANVNSSKADIRRTAENLKQAASAIRETIAKINQSGKNKTAFTKFIQKTRFGYSDDIFLY